METSENRIVQTPGRTYDSCIAEVAPAEASERQKLTSDRRKREIIGVHHGSRCGTRNAKSTKQSIGSLTRADHKIGKPHTLGLGKLLEKNVANAT